MFSEYQFRIPKSMPIYRAQRTTPVTDSPDYITENTTDLLPIQKCPAILTGGTPFGLCLYNSMDIIWFLYGELPLMDNGMINHVGLLQDLNDSPILVVNIKGSCKLGVNESNFLLVQCHTQDRNHQIRKLQTINLLWLLQCNGLQKREIQPH